MQNAAWNLKKKTQIVSVCNGHKFQFVQRLSFFPVCSIISHWKWSWKLVLCQWRLLSLVPPNWILTWDIIGVQHCKHISRKKKMHWKIFSNAVKAKMQLGWMQIWFCCSEVLKLKWIFVCSLLQLIMAAWSQTEQNWTSSWSQTNSKNTMTLMFDSCHKGGIWWFQLKSTQAWFFKCCQFLATRSECPTAVASAEHESSHSKNLVCAVLVDACLWKWNIIQVFGGCSAHVACWDHLCKRAFSCANHKRSKMTLTTQTSGLSRKGVEIKDGHLNNPQHHKNWFLEAMHVKIVNTHDFFRHFVAPFFIPEHHLLLDGTTKCSTCCLSQQSHLNMNHS